MGKVTGVGSIVIDLTAFTPKLPVAGETVKGYSFKTGCGGKGSNQMTAAKRAGAEAVIISNVGDDEFKNIVTEHYAKDNMSLKYVNTLSGYSTSVALIEVDKTSGQNRIVVITDACDALKTADVLRAEEEFKTADVILTQNETSFESIAEAKRLAEKYNKIFIYNPAPYKDIPLEFLNGVDYITPNESEAEALTHIKTDTIDGVKAAAQKLISLGVKNVIITLGIRGAYFLSKTEEYFIDSIKVEAVETTGAGDAFNGGFAAAICEGKNVLKSLRFATCTSAISVTRIGSGASMPARGEITALYEKTYGESF